MNKAQLKHLIKEVIQEIENSNSPHADVEINLVGLNKGLTGKLADVPINYQVDNFSASAGEAPSWDSPGDDEEVYFDVTYTAYEDTVDASGKLVLKKGEKIPEAAINPKDVQRISDEIIEAHRN